MPEDTAQARLVRTGLQVYTQDGEHLGEVKEVRGDGYFKVNAKMQKDYWLQSEFVESVSGDRVTMEFTKDDHGDYKVDEPAEAPVVTGEGRATDASAFPENTAASVVREAERRQV